MKTTVIKPHKSSIGGMEANILALLMLIGLAAFSWIPYVGYASWAIPLVIFFIEKKSKFVKFYAATAIGLSIIGAVISVVFAIIIFALTPRTYQSIINYAMGRGWGAITFFTTLALIVSIAFLALYIFLIIMAASYKQIELPLIGPLALKYSGKPDSAGSGTKSKSSTKKTTRKKKTTSKE